MMHHVGAGVYLKDVFVSWCTRPLLLYYQNHCYHVTKYENSQWQNDYMHCRKIYVQKWLNFLKNAP